MENIREKFVIFLKNLNIQFKYEGQNIAFEKNGLNYLFMFFENDPYYFRLSLPVIDQHKKDKDERINSINRQYKVAKLLVVEENIWLVADSFVYSTGNVERLFDRLLILLEEMIMNYRAQSEKGGEKK